MSNTIIATVCSIGYNCLACESNDETVPASYIVTSDLLRRLSIYDASAHLCDTHLDILHEKRLDIEHGI